MIKKVKKEMRQITERNMILDEYKRQISYLATCALDEVMQRLQASWEGLDEQTVEANRDSYGNNSVTRGKQITLSRKLMDAFINPFTAILLLLAIVSIIADMILPYLSLLGKTAEDFDCLTVVIILTMVVISGSLRFVQESRSGNAPQT